MCIMSYIHIHIQTYVEYLCLYVTGTIIIFIIRGSFCFLILKYIATYNILGTFPQNLDHVLHVLYITTYYILLHQAHD